MWMLSNLHQIIRKLQRNFVHSAVRFVIQTNVNSLPNYKNALKKLSGKRLPHISHQVKLVLIIQTVTSLLHWINIFNTLVR